MRLPRFYDENWFSKTQLGEHLGAHYALPNETGAFDCINCTMAFAISAPRPSGPTRDQGPFRPDLKCCTYHPFLPSFTLGALLKKTEDATLHSEVLHRYLALSRLDPLGAHSTRPPTAYETTGKNESDRCPFLIEGKCQIYDYRPSTCAGYVCRSNEGQEGLKKWAKWEGYLAEFEWTLAHEVAFSQGYTYDDIRKTFSSLEEAEKFYRKSLEIAQAVDIEQCFGLNADI